MLASEKMLLFFPKNRVPNNDHSFKVIKTTTESQIDIGSEKKILVA